jgi:hypothetical protein
MKKSYRELIKLATFEERFEYLRLGGIVGDRTFGGHRYLNQIFYRSMEWRRFRRDIIIRDDACDLACSDRPIMDRIIVHHINPITIEDIELGRDCVFDPDNVICCSHNTSNALHYGDISLLITIPPERRKGDTKLW